MPDLPTPIPSPSTPTPWNGDSSADLEAVRPGEMPKKKKRPSMTQVILLSALAAVTSTGGTIVFLLGYATTVKAEAVTAAQAIAQVQAQRVDVMQADLSTVKASQAALDAGFSDTVRRLEQKIDDANKRNEERYDKIADGQRVMLQELRKK